MTVELKYALRDRVFINELKTEGSVISIFIGDSGVQFRVRWFDTKDPKTDYFYEDELCPHKIKEDMGFKPI